MTGWRKRQVLEMAEKSSPSKQDWWKDDDALEAFAALVREDKREACAKVCDYMASRCNDIRAAALESAAENIRARGQA
jgi:hypothetical protein